MVHPCGRPSSGIGGTPGGNSASSGVSTSSSGSSGVGASEAVASSSGNGGGGISAAGFSKISAEPPYMELATSSAAGRSGAAGTEPSSPRLTKLGE